MATSSAIDIGDPNVVSSTGAAHGSAANTVSLRSSGFIRSPQGHPARVIFEPVV
jgi:hypothetical protein